MWGSVMQSFEAVVFVTRQYHWLVKPLEVMVEKYLNIPLTYLSDRPIETKHKVIEAFPLDCKLYAEPVGAKVKAALSQITAPNLLFFFADFIPQEPVDMEKLNALSDFMVENPNVARANLWNAVQEQIKSHCAESTDRLMETVGEMKIIKIATSMGQIGSTSLMPAIWSKQFIIEFMGDDWQLDHIEVPGQKRFEEQSKWFSIGTHPGLLQIAHLCYTRDLKKVHLTQLKEEDRPIFRAHIPPDFSVEE